MQGGFVVLEAELVLDQQPRLVIVLILLSTC